MCVCVCVFWGGEGGGGRGAVVLVREGYNMNFHTVLMNTWFFSKVHILYRTAL